MNLLIINGLDISHLVKYEVTYSRLFGPNSGRDLKGNNHMDLVGIFNTVTVTTGNIKEDELSTIIRELNKVSVTVSFYDPEYKALYQNCSMYVPDFTASLKRYKRNPQFNQFSFELIANNKRR